MQREFDIFSKPPADSVAVKRGFCWPGFFFSWIWALSCGLWLEGGLILFVQLLFLGAQIIFQLGPALHIMLSIALAIFIGSKGNFWRCKKLEQSGYSFEGVVSADSPTAALSVFARGEKLGRGTIFGNSFFTVPKWCQKIFAIAGLTWKAALRFKLFLVIAVLLVLAVVGLPLIIKDDGTAQGFTQIILTYTLSAITALLGLSTLWLSCGTLARDIEECQIQVVATKPIARWQIWLGKWLGLVTLNAALLAISGACVYGTLMYRASKLSPEVQKNLHDQILVARGSAKEADSTKEIEAETDRYLQEKLKSAAIEKVDVPEVRRQLREQVKASFQLVQQSYMRTWKIDLGFAKDRLKDKPLQLRVKFNSAQKSPSGTFTLMWAVGVEAEQKLWRSEPMSLAPDTFHEFEIPADMFDKDGVLTVSVLNPNPTALLFPLDEGVEVLYPEGGFTLNFARGLGIIFCWLAVMAALGLMAASFLSFPVATFFSLAMLTLVLSSGMLADAVDSGSVAAGNEETGQAGHSVFDVVLIPAFKGLLQLIKLVEGYSPVDSLSTGRSITWSQLGMAFAQIVVLIGGFFAVMGIIFFNRRELATAQGTQ